MDTSSFTVSNSTIETNSQRGIDIRFGTSPTITSNTIQDNTLCAIRMGGGTLGLMNNTIQNNDDCAIHVTAFTDLTSVSGNTIQNNVGDAYLLENNGVMSTLNDISQRNTVSGNGLDGLNLTGTISMNGTLVPDSVFPFVVEGNLILSNGFTLNIDPGTIFKKRDQGFPISFQGTVNAIGTESNPIIFTSFKDDTVGGDTNGDGTATTPSRLDWTGLVSGIFCVNCVFDHILVKHAASFSTFQSSSVTLKNSTFEECAAGIQITDASPTIMNNTFQNSGLGSVAAIWIQNFDATGMTKLAFPLIKGNIIQNNNMDGIRVFNFAEPTIEDNLIKDNTGDGIIISSGLPLITGNFITGNTNLGIQNEFMADPHVSAENNYWGHPSGPLDDSDDTGTGGLFNPAGQGDKVSDFIDYQPFLTTEPFPVGGVNFETSAQTRKEDDQTVMIKVLLSLASTNTIMVDYAVTGGSATGGGVDFTLANGTLTFVPGDTEEIIDLMIHKDAIDETAETLVITLSNPVNTSLGTMTTHTVTITEEESTVYQYDSVGNLISVVDDHSALAFTYDHQERLLTATTAGSPNQPDVTLTYTYDAQGNRQTMNDGIDGVTNYLYDDLNRVDSITNPAMQMVDYDYDVLSRKTMTTLPNGVVTHYIYDSNSNVTQVDHAKNLTTLSSFNYPYDTANQRTGLTTQRPIPTAQNNVTYEYDSLGQLTRATDPVTGNPDETFVYDPVGNRLSQQGQTVNSAYDMANRLTEDESFQYDYDENGNLTERVDKSSGQIDRMTYDGYDRLIMVQTLPSAMATPTQTVRYVYDALDRRIVKDVDGTQTNYVYDFRDIVWEFSNNSTPAMARYTHGLDIDEPLIMTRQSVSHFFLADGLGSITDLTDDMGAVEQSYLYDGFGGFSVFDQTGAPILASSGIVNPYGFTGREIDLETNFFFYRARYFDPVMGRFLAEDPLGFEGEDINLYRYVLNNPTNLKDPNGTIPLALAVPVISGAINGVGEAFACKGGFLDKLGALGRGFAAGAIGGLAGLVSGYNPFVTGAVSSATTKFADNLFRGRKQRLKDLLKAGVRGALTAGVNSKFYNNGNLDFAQKIAARRINNSAAGQLGKKCGC